jgi:hypothetical protein
MSLTLLPHWESCTVPRLGLAALTRRAFAGENLAPLWHRLMEQASDDAAGSGMGMDLSVIAQLQGDKQTGLAIQREMLALNRLYRSPAPETARLRVLALAAECDIGGNTPLEFLLAGGDIALATLYLTPGEKLPDTLPDHDIAIVTAPGGSPETLAMIADLTAKWPRPLLNAPDRIAGLERDCLYRLLTGIAGLSIPATAQTPRAVLAALATGQAPLLQSLLPGAQFPLIVRPVGSHAGFGLARLADAGALDAYLAGRGEEMFFLSPFIDYASADGLFRKYRLVLADGRWHPCHMAIAEEWKVWYLNADMAVSVPHRTEEALFMEFFDGDFARRHRAALDAMADRLGLDYLIVDCAETRDGQLLVFEADPSAIVHDMDPPSVYPYKPKAMARIFRAVQAMLARHAAAKNGALCRGAA